MTEGLPPGARLAAASLPCADGLAHAANQNFSHGSPAVPDERRAS